VLAIFFVPVFFVVVRKMFSGVRAQPETESPQHSDAGLEQGT
jgi:hypothetical protein